MPIINIENGFTSVNPVTRRGMMMNVVICHMDKEQIYNAILEFRKETSPGDWVEMMVRLDADLDAIEFPHPANPE